MTRILLASIALAVLSAGAAQAEPRNHDGFYFRLGVGPGYAIATLDTGAGSDDSTGANISTQLAVGWTVRRGLVVGGATFPMVVLSPSYDGIDAGGQHVSATGPFVDYYPNSRKGLHFHGGLLFSLGYLDGGDRASHIGAGYGASLGVGYDFFVTDEWSIGGIARATAYHLYGVDDSMRLFSPALLVSLVRH
ncbi:MAG TPA: hypothetical protein VN253_23455 [Kofleriaceae bacterium]|nr:hypothetical protein [Kofleriaceae bacterium]